MHGAGVVSYDNDFGPFSGVPWERPDLGSVRSRREPDRRGEPRRDAASDRRFDSHGPRTRSRRGARGHPSMSPVASPCHSLDDAHTPTPGSPTRPRWTPAAVSRPATPADRTPSASARPPDRGRPRAGGRGRARGARRTAWTRGDGPARGVDPPSQRLGVVSTGPEPQDLHDAARSLARDRGTTLSQAVAELVRRGLGPVHACGHRAERHDRAARHPSRPDPDPRRRPLARRRWLTRAPITVANGLASVTPWPLEPPWSLPADLLPVCLDRPDLGQVVVGDGTGQRAGALDRCQRTARRDPVVEHRQGQSTVLALDVERESRLSDVPRAPWLALAPSYAPGRRIGSPASASSSLASTWLSDKLLRAVLGAGLTDEAPDRSRGDPEWPTDVPICTPICTPVVRPAPPGEAPQRVLDIRTSVRVRCRGRRVGRGGPPRGWLGRGGADGWWRRWAGCGRRGGVGGGGGRGVGPGR